jgi:hypothetical protein
VTGSDITSDASPTISVALGDLDGDGDLDFVAGNNNTRSRFYLNNGTSDPFAGVVGKDITPDVLTTLSIALGDLDSDGDLDLVAGNGGVASRFYLNNGTSDPFAGVTGRDFAADSFSTRPVALGDMNGDGNLDVVIGGDSNGKELLYLNKGVPDLFDGVLGIQINDGRRQPIVPQ